MRLTLESTTKVIELQMGLAKVPARIWQGTLDDGTPVHAYITLVAVPTDAPASVHERFERELQEQATPRADVQAIPTRLIL